MKYVIAAGFALTALFAGVGVTASATDGQEVCAPLDSGKIDVDGELDTITVSSPSDDLVITGYCVKAGSDVSVPEGAVVYVLIEQSKWSPTITFSHPSGKNISHYSLAWQPFTPETTTTTTTLPPPPPPPPVETTTTAPATTTTVAQTTTTVPQTTTTVAQTTTTAPATTTTAPATTTTAPRVTTTAPPPPPAAQLPSTGTSNWTIAALATFLLTIGTGLIAATRRR